MKSFGWNTFFPSDNPLTSLSLKGLLFLNIALSLVTLVKPVLLNGDFITCWMSWDYFQLTGYFHHLPRMSISLPGEISPVFLSWWSPGAYVGPAAFSLLGFNLGASLALWLVLAGCLALFAWSFLYRSLGFSDLVTAISLILMFCAWHTFYSFRIYHGGEVILLAIFPALTSFLLLQKPGSWPCMACLAFITLIGALVKLSFLILSLGLLLYACLEVFWSKEHLSRRLSGIFRMGLGWVLGYGMVHLLFLRFGSNPSDGHHFLHPEEIPRMVFQTLSMPFSAMIGFESMMGRLLPFLSPSFSRHSIFFTTAVFLLSTVVYTACFHGASTRRQRFLILSLFLSFAGIMVLFQLRGSAISLEDRHARMVALLLLPGLVSFGLNTRRLLLRLAVGSILAGNLLWGISSLIYYWTSPGAGMLSSRGYRTWSFTGEDLALFQELRNSLKSSNSLVVVPTIDAALEFPGQTVIALDSFDPQILSSSFKAGYYDDLLILRPRQGPNETPATSGMEKYLDSGPFLRKIEERGHWRIFLFSRTLNP